MESLDVIPPDDVAVNFDPNLGGKITTSPAFALLTGQYEDLKTSSVSRLHVPITTLPAILGRTQAEPDDNVSMNQLSFQWGSLDWIPSYLILHLSHNGRHTT